MILQFLVACVGTIAFSHLFFIPREYYPYCGGIGGIGWIVCLALTQYFNLSITVASFFSAAVVVLCSRAVCVAKKCPVTMFLISGIFPLVPGAGVYETIYHVIMNEGDLAMAQGLQTLKVAVAIVLAITFVSEIPHGFFKPRSKSSK